MSASRKAIPPTLRVVLVLLLACAGGCGADEGAVVARVGGAEIHQPAVAHWARAIERGATPSGVPGWLTGAPRQQALEFLIASHWLAGQAAALGVPVPKAAVERAVAERREANGTDEFAKTLREAGQTLDDVRLELASELASAAIDRRLAARAAKVPRAELDDYYARNRRRLAIPETRVVDLIERLPSGAAVRAELARVGPGAGFTRAARRETLQHGRIATAGIVGKAAFVHAIFAARVGVASPPMPLDHGWAMFVVRRIEPQRVRPPEQVRGEIGKRLVPVRLREIRRQFIAAYQAHWRVRTSCLAQYVVAGCLQYHGALAPELGGLAASG
jgi:parvulin-like peptidyl-prolyl isomerase